MEPKCQLLVQREATIFRFQLRRVGFIHHVFVNAHVLEQWRKIGLNWEVKHREAGAVVEEVEEAGAVVEVEEEVAYIMVTKCPLFIALPV